MLPPRGEFFLAEGGRAQAATPIELFEPGHQPSQLPLWPLARLAKDEEFGRACCESGGRKGLRPIARIGQISMPDDEPPPRRKASHYRLDSDISGDLVVIGTCRIAGVTLTRTVQSYSGTCNDRWRLSGVVTHTAHRRKARHPSFARNARRGG